ncbi:MAG: GNAT family N-acetyltransferase [Pseudobdellovibrionaceae bacterium]
MSTGFYIETPRLKLILPHMDYVEEIQAAKEAVWDQLQLWMSWSFDDAKNIESTKAFIRAQSDFASRDFSLIGLDKETGRFAVSTGLNKEKDAGPDAYHTGYWVAPEFLGRGYATESTLGVLHYAFQAGGAKEVHINYYQDNEKSRRVIEKCGFTYMDTDTLGAVRPLDGTALDKHNYVMRDPALLPPLAVSWNIPDGLKRPA